MKRLESPAFPETDPAAYCPRDAKPFACKNYVFTDVGIYYFAVIVNFKK